MLFFYALTIIFLCIQSSLQSSYFRLRIGVRAAFEVLRKQSFDHENSSVGDDR